jgi:hypothetical protein
MKLTHRPPGSSWFAAPAADHVDDGYEAEVQRSTQHGEREYQQAQGRLARAEQRLAGAVSGRATAARKKRLAALRALVDERRAELAALERLMTAAPVTAIRQARHRTGRDDHLELGATAGKDNR